MILKVDIGIDELRGDLFQIIVMTDTGETFCHIFGKTPEECNNRANRLKTLFNESN